MVGNIGSVLDLLAPLKSSRITKAPAPWLTPDLKLLMKQRKLRLNKFKRTKNATHWNEYTELRNLCTTLVRRNKKNFIQETVESKNATEIWRTFRALRLSKGSTGALPDHLLDAESMNNHFVDSLPRTKANDTEFHTYGAASALVKNELNFVVVDEADVYSAILAMRSLSAENDDISVSILRSCCPFILPYLTHVVNFCITNSVFPSTWKVAAVMPIPKTGNPMMFYDLRPISILPAGQCDSPYPSMCLSSRSRLHNCNGCGDGRHNSCNRQWLFDNSSPIRLF